MLEAGEGPAKRARQIEVREKVRSQASTLLALVLFL
jgi:hypothetical protein